LQKLSNQLHDFNVGMGPDVGNVPGGNNFGTRVFWTAVVPDRDVEVDADSGRAELHVHDLAALDYPEDFGSGSLGPNWQTAYVPATVSFDVVWHRPVSRRVTVSDATDQFAGTFNEEQATVLWSARSDSGFRFSSLPGSSFTSTPGAPDITTTYFFAQVGHEQNGVFFDEGEREGEAKVPSPGEHAPLAVGPASTLGWGVRGEQTSSDAPLRGQPDAGPKPASAGGGQRPGQRPPDPTPFGTEPDGRSRGPPRSGRSGVRRLGERLPLGRLPPCRRPRLGEVKPKPEGCAGGKIEAAGADRPPGNPAPATPRPGARPARWGTTSLPRRPVSQIRDAPDGIHLSPFLVRQMGTPHVTHTPAGQGQLAVC
jgi:hypothetical protein